jgi:hypothetical protein
VTTVAHIRESSRDTAHEKAELRPSKAARRKWMKTACAARVAAGAHVPKSLRTKACHFTEAEIERAFPEELAEKAAALNAQRGTTDRRIDITPLEPGKKRRERAIDPHWAYRPSGTKERDHG